MIEKKNILITGSSKGIGSFIAKKLHEDKNNQIFINGRNKKDLIIEIKPFCYCMACPR